MGVIQNRQQKQNFEQKQYFTCIGRGHGAPCLPATREDWERLRREPWLAQMCARIEKGDDDLKHRLPVWTPHCAEFRGNHRAAADAVRPLRRLMMDFDEKGHTDEIMKNLECRTESVEFLRPDGSKNSKLKVLLIEESVRRGTHVLVELPVGMSAEQAQELMASVTGFKPDAAVKDVSRCIYMVTEGHTRYVSAKLFEAPDVEVSEAPEAQVSEAQISEAAGVTKVLPLSRGTSPTSVLPLSRGSQRGSEQALNTVDQAKGLSIDQTTPNPSYSGGELIKKSPSYSGGELIKKNPSYSGGELIKKSLSYSGGESVTQADARTLFIFDACMKEAELTPDVLVVEGHRHEALKSILSVGATQLLKKEELMGVLQVRMAANWQDKNIQQLVDDFYSKYYDPSQKMSAFQRKVLAKSLKMSASEILPLSRGSQKGSEQASGSLDQTTPSPSYSGGENNSEASYLGGENNSEASYSGGENNSEASYSGGEQLPPEMPKKLPKVVALLLSKTPDVYKPAVAHAIFPSLGAHLWKVRFPYIDNVQHEATFMNVLMAGTGAGKDCISQPINHIMRDIRERDAENLRREAEWKKEVNAKGANKDRRQRPEGLVIQEVDPDMTNPAFVMRMAEADEHFLYTKMNEIDQFDALRGSAHGSQQFQIMCLAFDPDNRYGQTRVGTQSVTEKVTIRFNWNAATTIQKGQKYFSRVLTDGPISRINFCTIPEREIGADMPVYGTYDAAFDEELRPFIERLTRAAGTIDCPQAFRLAKRLKDECAEFARLSQSRVYENLSFRANVIAYLKACVLYICNDYKWSREIEEFVRWSLKYDLWCKMQFFGEAIEQANRSADEQTDRRGPRNLLELLPDQFTLHDAELARQQQGMNTEGTRNMLNQWTHRGYIEPLTNYNYNKLKFLSNESKAKLA